MRIPCLAILIGLFAVSCGCQSLLRFQYVGIYEIDYQKESVDRATAFRLIVGLVAKSCDLSYEIIEEKPYAKMAFLYSKDPNRTMPDRLVLSEDSGARFGISIIKTEPGEPEETKKLRQQIEAGLRSAGLQHGTFYIQKTFGQLWNS